MKCVAPIAAVLALGAGAARAEDVRLFPVASETGWRFGAGGFYGVSAGRGGGGFRGAMGVQGEAIRNVVGADLGSVGLSTRLRFEYGPWSDDEDGVHTGGTAWTASLSEGVKPCLMGVVCAEAAVGGRIVTDGETEAVLFAEGRVSLQLPFAARGGAELGFALGLQQETRSGDAEGFVFVNGFWR